MILTCGEAVTDMLPAQLRDGGAGLRPVAGGAAVNTAIALARLGCRAGFFGALSTDGFGRQMTETLLQEGVDLHLAPRIDAPSTLAVVHPADDGSPQFSFFDEASAARHLGVAHLPALDGVSALVLGGISLVHPPGAGVFEALMHAAGEARPCLLDPNIRPALIGAEAPQYRARLARMMAMADILKLSDEDIDWLRPDPPERWLSGRASLVVHTHGAGGATLYSRHGTRHLPAPEVPVADTVGAGDTFNAGLLAGLQAAGLLAPDALARAPEAALVSAAELGIRAAAASVSRPGAAPPHAREIA